MLKVNQNKVQKTNQVWSPRLNFGSKQQEQLWRKQKNWELWLNYKFYKWIVEINNKVCDLDKLINR